MARSRRITVVFPESELLDEVQRAAAAMGVPVSEMIRTLITWGLEELTDDRE